MQLFDINTIKQNSNICILGNSHSNKNKLIKNIMVLYKDYSIGNVIIQKKDMSFYSSFIPIFFIHDKYEPHLLKIILNRQKKENKPSLLLIDNSIEKCDNALSNFINTTKNNNLTFILSMSNIIHFQYAIFDYIFIFNETNEITKKNIYKLFFSWITYDTFCDILNKYTLDENNCLVLSLNSKTETELLFYYKINETNMNYKMFDKEYWKF